MVRASGRRLWVIADVLADVTTTAPLFVCAGVSEPTARKRLTNETAVWRSDRSQSAPAI
jgi:hypothetical protein